MMIVMMKMIMVMIMMMMTITQKKVKYQKVKVTEKGQISKGESYCFYITSYTRPR